MKKDFSIYLDLDMKPREVATLSLTLKYRKEEMIRNIQEYKKDITETDKPELQESLNTTLRYFEETIEDIDNIFIKLNLSH